MIIVFILLIDTVSLSWMVFADCIKSDDQSDEQCCTGYVWNENLKQCERCNSGFTGPSCNTKCPYPSYGLDCQMICDCTNTFCNFQYGCISPGCNEGFYGPLCLKKCPYPSYGKGCQGICSCKNESCDYKHGCIDSDNVFTSSTNSRSFNGITSKALTQSKIKALSNESDLYMYIHSTGMKRNAILSSTLTITQSRGNKDNDFRFKNGSTTFSGNIKNMNEETTESGSNSILILTISLNTFVILIICCIFVLCLFCKRKWIVQQIFENDEKGNLYDKKRSYAKRRIFQEPARLLYKHQDVDIEMTEMTASVGNFINGNPVTQSMPQEGHYSRDVYENDIDPYLAPPMTESVLENHQYLTVV